MNGVSFFLPALMSPPPWPEHPNFRAWMGWLFEISQGQNPPLLQQTTLVAIAFLVAVLTVIALWEISPSTRPSAPVGPQNLTGTPAAEKSSLAAPFQGNFGRTVLSGLGGLTAVSALNDALGPHAMEIYAILFIAFFLGLLLLSALYQGVTEALRSRILLVERPPEWRPRQPRTARGFEEWRRSPKGATAGQTVDYYRRAFWSWLVSWRYAGLVFLDTVFNVVQGKNQLQSAGFSRDLLNLRWSQIWVACRVREDLDRAITRKLQEGPAAEILKAKGIPLPEPEDIRVNVTALSQDEREVSYVSWERGSLGRSFPKRSIAWLSVFSGEARWHKKSYPDDAVLFRNEDGRIPVGEPEIRVGNFFQARASDYEAFMILPLPWTRRGETREYQRAGLMISFRRAEYMDALWTGLDAIDEKGRRIPNYDQAKNALAVAKPEPQEPARSAKAPAPAKVLAVNLAGDVLSFEELATEDLAAELPQAASPALGLRDPELSSLLHLSVEVLTEALRFFNPTVFREQILPQLNT